MKTYKAIDIANKILAKATETDYCDLVSNLKLQKMLYYMQGFHLAYFNTHLFEEEIEAWQYGPVVRDVYFTYNEYGNNGIEYKEDVTSLTDEQEDLFNEVYDIFIEYSAIGLMNMTHEEEPWKNTQINSIIPKEIMKKYFKTRLL